MSDHVLLHPRNAFNGTRRLLEIVLSITEAASSQKANHDMCHLHLQRKTTRMCASHLIHAKRSLCLSAQAGKCSVMNRLLYDVRHLTLRSTECVSQLSNLYELVKNSRFLLVLSS